MKEQALISIIIPTYNRADTIMPSLFSVQKQSYTNFECLIVDDYSTDDTLEVIKEFASRDPRFLIINNTKTKGAPGARNTGLAHANGEYIIFLDSDDILLDFALRQRIDAFQQDTTLHLVLGAQLRLEQGKPLALVNIPTTETPLTRFFSLYPCNDIPWITGPLIKKTYLDQHHIQWDEQLMRFQDVQFNLQVMLQQPRFKWLPIVDFHWIGTTTSKNIGKDLSNYADKLHGIGLFFNQQLKAIALKQPQLQNRLKKRIKAFYAYNLYDLKKEETTTFLDHIKNSKLFTNLELALLHKYHKAQAATIQRFYRLYFKLTLAKALGPVNFLKHQVAKMEEISITK